MPYEVLHSTRVYQGRFISLDRDTIALPDGREAVREVVRRGPAAVIIPVDEQGKLLFVRQYRHPYRGMSLELPAGVLEPGEDPLHCGVRELKEETGAEADRVESLDGVYASLQIAVSVV